MKNIFTQILTFWSWMALLQYVLLSIGIGNVI